MPPPDPSPDPPPDPPPPSAKSPLDPSPLSVMPPPDPPPPFPSEIVEEIFYWCCTHTSDETALTLILIARRLAGLRMLGIVQRPPFRMTDYELVDRGLIRYAYFRNGRKRAVSILDSPLLGCPHPAVGRWYLERFKAGHRAYEDVDEASPPGKHWSYTATFAARGGHIGILQWIHDNNLDFLPRHAADHAAAHGQLDALRLLWGWAREIDPDAQDAQDDLICVTYQVALGGDIGCIEWCIEQGAADLSNMLRNVIRFGHSKTAKHLIDRGVRVTITVAGEAARRGLLDIMKMCRKARPDYNPLECAAAGGKIAAMHLCKSWGVTEELLSKALAGSHMTQPKAAGLCMEWGAACPTNPKRLRYSLDVEPEFFILLCSRPINQAHFVVMFKELCSKHRLDVISQLRHMRERLGAPPPELFVPVIHGRTFDGESDYIPLLSELRQHWGYTPDLIPSAPLFWLFLHRGEVLHLRELRAWGVGLDVLDSWAMKNNLRDFGEAQQAASLLARDRMRLKTVLEDLRTSWGANIATAGAGLCRYLIIMWGIKECRSELQNGWGIRDQAQIEGHLVVQSQVEFRLVE